MFERADALMYEEKQLLKGLGAVTRDDAEEAVKQKAPSGDEQVIVSVVKKVLTVEGEPVNQMMLGAALQDEYDILYASDGEEALEVVKAGVDDLSLMLLDLQMPGMNGREVLRIMKEDPGYSKLPVIVLTADQTAEVDCLRLGAMDFIPKPYPSWEIVRARVRRCIELSENRNIIQSTERDSLTRLFNIDYFLRYVKMYDQHYHDMAMDAVVLDVNRFHILNERYGKAYGDSVLGRIGERIRQIVREIKGVGCRRCADTFLLYCPHRERYDDILDRVSQALKDDEKTSNRVRLRLGIYAKADKEIDIERRFDYAKIAADNVKGNYVDTIGWYDSEMRERELYRERLLEDFWPSLENDRFTVYYQPKYDIRPETPVLVSAEALVRWNHPELGIITPDDFIPLLEDNGLILELDRFVWRETAARIREWKDRLDVALPVSVNVSRVDMLTPNLKGIFREILNDYGLTADDMILEIT
ncbi:MAG: EAL domain-containing protein [Clostridia bacterium]|nr:EAL domain-containing protein [Clostridia bacterium]